MSDATIEAILCDYKKRSIVQRGNTRKLFSLLNFYCQLAEEQTMQLFLFLFTVVQN